MSLRNKETHCCDLWLHFIHILDAWLLAWNHIAMSELGPGKLDSGSLGMAFAWCLWCLSASFVSCLCLLKWCIRKIELYSRLSADELETASKVEKEVPTGKGRYLRIMLVTTRRWTLCYSSPWLTFCAYLTSPLLRCMVDKQLQQNRGSMGSPGPQGGSMQHPNLLPSTHASVIFFPEERNGHAKEHLYGPSLHHSHQVSFYWN